MKLTFCVLKKCYLRKQGWGGGEDGGDKVSLAPKFLHNYLKAEGNPTISASILKGKYSIYNCRRVGSLDKVPLLSCHCGHFDSKAEFKRSIEIEA